MTEIDVSIWLRILLVVSSVLYLMCCGTSGGQILGSLVIRSPLV